MAESEEELKSLLMKVKEESEKVGLKLNIQKTKIMASGPITSWEIDRETLETVSDFIFGGSKITANGDCSHEIKRHLLLGRKVMTNRDSILKKVKVSPEVEQERNLCAHHGEKLHLFCEQDGKEHRGHITFLMEEIAPEYQKKLQSCLQRLKGKKQEAEELEIKVREEMSTWKIQIQNEIQNVQGKFTQLRQILDNEEIKELRKLKDELGVILKELLLVSNLISDVERHLQGSTMELLQDANVIMKRSETLALKKPKSFPREQRRVFRAPDLREILRVSNELTDVQRNWVQVTLNSPKCANVVIFPDQRQVRYASSDQGYNAYLNYNYETFGVLGSPVITSGRHYWEVDMLKKSAWILGVCGYKPKNRNCGNCHNVYSRYQPKNGYWVIGLKHDSVYNAFESSFSGPVILTLSLSVSPHRVGVFLDYEARTVLFLNVTNHGFPIYTVSSCSFPQNIVPYFSPMNCGAPMTLCSPSR
uniref:B30.2/SPRY domain-containing protein n=1 Tax=Bos mutus grunniens TaxID=30521 RepID=A0A8B9YVW1_BOSMU